MFYSTKKLSKYRRVKSQQIFQTPKPDTQEEDLTHNIHRISGVTYLLQIVKPKSNKSIKILIPAHLTIKQIKNIICQKLDITDNSIYFFSFDFDYHFDFRFHQNIGKLDMHRKLGYRLIHESRADFSRKNINDYFIYDCLSVGGFSKVFLSRCKLTGRFYAAKFIDKHFQLSPKFQDLIYNQKHINQILDYPFLVKMHEFIESEQFYIFILDYCPSGQLFSLMKSHRNMTQQEAKFYFIETILAIQYMHSQSIIYRDIKPENILLDKFGHIKIADFGLAKVLRDKTNSYCGSLQYMAPQIVQGVQHSFGVDHYCLGSLLYEMMVGCPPFYNPNFNQIQTKYHIVNSNVKFPTNKQLSPQIIDIISKLLDKNPKTRLGSISGIKQILSHPWMGKFDRQKYQNKQIDPPFKIGLEKSNFQSTYLPKQEIEKMKKKINRQLNQKDYDRQSINRKQKRFYMSFHGDKEEKEGSKFKRLKSSQDKSVTKSSNIDMKAYSKYFSKDKSQKVINPYQSILRKREKKLSFSSNLSKSKNKLLTVQIKDFKKVKNNRRNSKELGAILYLQGIRNKKIRASLGHLGTYSKGKSKQKNKQEREGRQKCNYNMCNNQIMKTKVLNKRQVKKDKQNMREKFSFKSDQLKKILREKYPKPSIENEERVFQPKQSVNRLSSLFAENIVR